MENRYFIELSYNGTSYHGWQIQPNAVTVQQKIEEALSLLTKNQIRVTGAGRTDTGVHARYFMAHFDLPSPFTEPPSIIARRINHILPGDIAISDIFVVDKVYHSRFSARSRTYEYQISRNKDPFNQNTSYLITSVLDIEQMNNAACELFNYKDFKSFSRTNSGAKTSICHIKYAKWEERGNMLTFRISADRFLRNMVRAIVGTMIDIGFGKLSIQNFREIIQAGDRRKAGMSAPAKGLFLTDIEFPAEIFKYRNPHQPLNRLK